MSQILTVKELMKMYPPVKLAHGDRWGNWIYNAKNLTLVIKKPSYRSGYDIDLERCTTANEALTWIVHMQGKAWMSDKDLRDLIRALDDTLDLYQLSQNGRIGDIKNHLQHRAYIKDRAEE
jgi:hypothetical protein